MIAVERPALAGRDDGPIVDPQGSRHASGIMPAGELEMWVRREHRSLRLIYWRHANRIGLTESG